jgi:hypothetical protein
MEWSCVVWGGLGQAWVWEPWGGVGLNVSDVGLVRMWFSGAFTAGPFSTAVAPEKGFGWPKMAARAEASALAICVEEVDFWADSAISVVSATGPPTDAEEGPAVDEGAAVEGPSGSAAKQ